MAVSTSEHVLAPVQQRGQDALSRLGLPTRKDEAWRLTNLSRLEAVARMPISSVATASDAPPRMDGVLRLVLDGVNDPLEGVTLPEGLTPLEPKELELALGHSLDRCGWSDDWLIEFNHASAHQLLALRVRGTVPPLELVVAAASGLIATRVLLVVEEKAQLELLQVFSGGASRPRSAVKSRRFGLCRWCGVVVCSTGR